MRDMTVEVRELYAASYTRLVGIVAVAAQDRQEAEEAVQEAFARLLGHWAKVSTYADPEAWVRGVALRHLSNRRRKRRNGWVAYARHGVGPNTAPPNADTVDVARALAQLPLAQRQVVVLHHLVGLDIASVAAELAVPSGTVKSRLSRACAALAPLLEEHHD